LTQIFKLIFYKICGGFFTFKPAAQDVCFPAGLLAF